MDTTSSDRERPSAGGAERALACDGQKGRGAALLDWLPTGPGRLLFLVAALFFTASGLSSTFVPIYLYELGGDSLTFLLLLLVPVFSVLAFTPLLLQRWRGPSFTRLLPVGILALGAFQVSLSTFGYPILLGLSWGLGLALFWPPFNTYLYDLTDGRKKIQEITVIGVALPGFAGVVGPAVGGFLAAQHGLGLPAVFVLAATLYLGAFLMSLDLPRPAARSGSTVTSPFRVRGYRRFAVAYGLLGFTDTSWVVYPLFLFVLADRSLLDVGLIVSVVSIFGAVVAPLTARWADRRRTTWVPALLGYLVFVGWLWGLGVTVQLWQVALLGIAGVAGGLQVALLRAYTTLFPTGSLPSAATGREMALGIGRLSNLVFTFLLLGSAPLTLALFHRYFLVLGTIALAIPIWIFLTRLRAPAPEDRGVAHGRLRGWPRRLALPGMR